VSAAGIRESLEVTTCPSC